MHSKTDVFQAWMIIIVVCMVGAIFATGWLASDMLTSYMCDTAQHFEDFGDVYTCFKVAG